MAVQRMPARGDETVLTASGISKRFPGVTALSEVDFDLWPGEVHVLVGENGAGKSTLVKVLAGIESVDEGRMRLRGRPYRPRSPQDAIQAGVRVVHQEINLLTYLSVAENLFLERLPRRAGVVNSRRLQKDARQLLDRVGLDVPPQRKVEQLSIAQMQLVEIARALSARSQVLVLDEPTASLTGHETDRLFGIIRRLRADGVAVVYISHHLEELSAIGDRVTVLRNGRHVETRPADGLEPAEIVRMMVGRELGDVHPFPGDVSPGPELLRADGLRSRSMATAVSLSARAGEIVGIAGLVGAGRTETVRALFGADRPTGGKVYVGGSAVRIRRPADAIRAGISFVTEDRKAQGLILPMGCDVNITLAALRQVTRKGLLRRDRERSVAERMVHRLGIKTPSVRFPTRNLSGGNQQKVVLARWLFRDCRVLVVDEPCRGVDVGARHEIYLLLADLARQGKAVVMVSSDLSELMGMCHRIVVLSRGRVAGELPRDRFDQERILTLAYSGYRDGSASAPPAAAESRGGEPALTTDSCRGDT